MASLFQRLNRITAGTSSNPSAQSSQGTAVLRRSVAKRSEQELLSLWKLIMLKVQHLFRYAATKDRTILILGIEHQNRDVDLDTGRQNFLRVFQYLKEQSLRSPQVQEFTRVIGSELVGKPLAPSTGVRRLAVNDPENCPHPDKEMVPRGNGHFNNRTNQRNQVCWWTCKLCNSRWERMPVPAHPIPDEPQDSDRMRFGRHLGEQYIDVYNNHPT